MITAWRIVKARRAGDAFDGEGARLNGGRWNSPGTAAVYTAGSAALADLELLVHLNQGAALQSYVLIACTFAETCVIRLARSRLPSNWRSYPAPAELQSLGDAWINSRQSVVLEVPSAIVESESNYLLNPHHPGFPSITIGESKPFEFDIRLLRQ
jgi:RES domain-containing protein